MGAIDLVVQIEAPPSVASGCSASAGAGTSVDAVSEGVIFPKFRGDLVACAAVTRAMHDGDVEATRYPRNPLDVARAADRRHGGDRHVGRRRAVRHHPARGAVSPS